VFLPSAASSSSSSSAPPLDRSPEPEFHAQTSDESRDFRRSTSVHDWGDGEPSRKKGRTEFDSVFNPEGNEGDQVSNADEGEEEEYVNADPDAVSEAVAAVPDPVFAQPAKDALKAAEDHVAAAAEEEHVAAAAEEEHVAAAAEEEHAAMAAAEVPKQGRPPRAAAPKQGAFSSAANKLAEAAANKLAEAAAKEENALKALRAAKKSASMSRAPFTGPLSRISKGTVAKKFILDRVRLEDYDATAQAKRIHGADAVRAATTCALCGFLFKDRRSQRKTQKLGEECVSYDHFIPVNFAATVLRVVSAGGKYSQAEFTLFGLIGDLVCWHCNYEKSQSMFITCPSRDSFDELIPNVEEITEYYNRLARNEHFDAKDGINPTPTLEKCWKKYGLDREEWKRSRIAIATERALAVCDAIKKNVDYTIARHRIKFAKTLVEVVGESLLTDEKYNALPPENRHTYRLGQIVKQFAKEDLKITRPWKENVDVTAEYTNPLVSVPFHRVTPAFTPEQAAAAAAGPQPGQAGKKRGREGGKRHKTYRMRRCRLPKLL